ncbi:PrsW family glutamic-type intramembrane protease [Argonema antarcticum]|uniref:PrsW family glutamic-type intramembrane protease n=1 Tax=Argonema antarcticum TaxID=2942763 RepID=UPI0020113316|nr:PrsW family glutamic-type intramembrane protease [Argonema antarcticum]MCL1474934.1 PrsW family intramembrane metalloprotease [Argonema antarcticum A004/B2]
MTGDLSEGFLRQLLSVGAAGAERRYSLDTTDEIAIGRDLNCQVVLDSNLYGMVSRRHTVISHITEFAGATPSWLVCDLNSANGTYVNGQKLDGCRICREGDRIMLGQNGPEFIIEVNKPTQAAIQAPATSPGDVLAPTIKPPQSDSVSFTQLFPIFSTGRDLTQKAYLIPGIITVGFVVLMFATVGEARVFNLLLASYLAAGAYYFIYQLCGKHKPWWVLLACSLATILILISPLLQVFIIIFRKILPGNLTTDVAALSFPILLIRMFFAAGLMEELLKALPVLGACWLGRRLPSPWRERVGVLEPLDGILMGTASAVGFTLLETLGQYVPQIIQDATLQVGEGVGELVGLQLLIPRILGSVAGHMAYSGYLGYFIGLSVLKPSRRWQIISIGYLSAAALHALWNASGIISPLVLALVGVLSYAFLTAAILKARALSPL